MASSVPSAIQAFLSISQTALPSDAQVWFGKALPVYTAPITLQIMGVTNGMQEVVVMGPDYKREEDYEIQCLLTSYAGNNDYPSRLAEVFSNFLLISVAVGNNPTLNQTVRFAQIKSFEYAPDADPSGKSLGSLAFTVECQARISSLT